MCAMFRSNSTETISGDHSKMDLHRNIPQRTFVGSGTLGHTSVGRNSDPRLAPPGRIIAIHYVVAVCDHI